MRRCAQVFSFHRNCPTRRTFLDCVIEHSRSLKCVAQKQRPARNLPPGATETMTSPCSQLAGLVVAGAGFAAGFGEGFTAGFGADGVVVVAVAEVGVKACDAAVVPPCTPNCPPVPRPPLTS